MVAIPSGRPGLHAVATVVLVFKHEREHAVILNQLSMAPGVQEAAKKYKIVNMRQSVLVKVVIVNGHNGHYVLKHVETVHK